VTGERVVELLGFARAADAVCFVFVLRNEGRWMVWFNGVDPLIGRSVGGVSWIFDWLKRGYHQNWGFFIHLLKICSTNGIVC
jgi:hypothetical protein